MLLALFVGNGTGRRAYAGGSDKIEESFNREKCEKILKKKDAEAISPIKADMYSDTYTGYVMR